MKIFQKATFALALLPAFAFATSPRVQPTEMKVSPSLVQLVIADVGTQGTVLRTRHAHPYTDFLIGIPVTVSTGSACTDFVGQEATVSTPNVTRLRALGATDPVQDACIDVFPMPIATQLTLSMNVLTGGFVPAHQFQTSYVQIEGVGLFQVTLDLDAQKVMIVPAMGHQQH